MNNLHEIIEQLNIKLYTSTVEEDYLFAQLWDDLSATGEITSLLAPNAHSLSAFYSMFHPPRVAMYTTRSDSIESLHWIEPVSTSGHAVFFSSWTTRQMRGTKRHAILMAAIYSMIFAMPKKVIIGVTKQAQLLRLHQRIGYVILDSVPYLFGDESAWTMYLTQPAFEDGDLYRTALKALNKENEDGRKFAEHA